MTHRELTAADQDSAAEPPDPARRWCVPIRPGLVGSDGRPPAWSTIRLFRDPVGDRTAVAFTSPDRLTDVLGVDQPWLRLSEPALRDLIEPLGVGRITLDPQLSAPYPIPAAGEPATVDEYASQPQPTTSRTKNRSPRLVARHG